METAAVDVVTALRDAWAGALRARRSTGTASARTYLYASGIKDCDRAMALDLLHPEDWPEFSEEQLARMRRGEEREESVVAWLHQIGPRANPPFKVIDGQRRFEIKDRDGVLLIVGKVDCRLDFGGGVKPFVEVKSGESVRNVETFEDFERSPWTRHMPDQLLSYLYAENEPLGIFILDRPGFPMFIPVRLEEHLQRVERTLQRARRVVDVVHEDAPLPPFIQDAGACRRCHHFGKSCTPGLDFGAGATVISDEALIADAETRERTRAAHLDYEGADKRLKSALRGVELGVMGDFQVTGSWGRLSRLDLPAELKKAYTVTDERGTFRLKIERVA